MRPWLVLKHMGVEFDEIRVSLFEEGYKDQILYHSGAGKVPVFKEGDLIVWDSLAICEYLAERQPDLWPKSSEARAVARAVSAEMHAGFRALRSALPMNCRAQNRKVNLAENVVQEITRVMEIWVNARSHYGATGPWLFGDFSIADAMYAPVASRFVTYGIECDQQAGRYVETVMSNDHVQQWYAEASVETDVIESEEVG